MTLNHEIVLAGNYNLSRSLTEAKCLWEVQSLGTEPRGDYSTGSKCWCPGLGHLERDERTSHPFRRCVQEQEKEEKDKRRTKGFLLFFFSFFFSFFFFSFSSFLIWSFVQSWGIIHASLCPYVSGPLWTPLHAAFFNDHDEVVKLLLAHPNINVNLKNMEGQTPLSFGCELGKVSVVRLLLKDPRVDITLDDNGGRTPLWHASRGGHHKVIECSLQVAEIWETLRRKGNTGTVKLTRPLKLQENKTEVVSLLERFMANPAQTRHEARVKLRVLEEAAAEVFALTVFLCDELQLKPAPPPLFPCCHPIFHHCQ